jgi:uncharacterized protein YhaN
MKIETIHIDGFGVWSDKTVGPLGPGLNVFHGPNETGKSTLMAFIRAVLFGFEKRGSARRYDPVKGGTHGGCLDLIAAGQRIRIERKAGRHARGAVTVYKDGAVGDDAALEELLAGTTKTLYHNVFAFGLEELEQFHTLEETEIATRISGAGLGIGASRWAAVQKDLEERQSALFLSRGQNSSINVAFKELEAVRDDLDRTEHQPQEYLAAHEARTRLAAELSLLEDAVADLSAKVDRYAKRLKAKPYLEQRSKLEAILRELPAVDAFPEGGLERLHLLRQQRQNLIEQRSSKQREAEAKRLRRVQLRVDPEECGRRLQILESLRTLVPRADAVGRVYAASVKHREAVLQERRTLAATQSSVVPPSWPAFAVFLTLLWVAAAGLLAAEYFYVAAAIETVSLLAMFWYRDRLRRASVAANQVMDCSKRLDACQDQLRKTESEARQIEAEFRKLTGQSEVTQEDVDQRVAELDRLMKLSEEVRSLDEAAARGDDDVVRLSAQIEDVQTTIKDLLLEAGASNEQEFVARADVYKQRRRLIHELDKIPAEPAESGLLFEVHADDEAQFEAAQRELSGLEKRLAEARTETGRIEERISMMEKSVERSRALSRQETILARIDEAAEQWAVVTLCRALLDETRKLYETERQPEVLRQASHFYSVMTEGRYTRVIAPLDGGEIQVERADGNRLSPQALSRGTAEQLYLSMRLALVREYANHVDPLPVVFDDIFVNFDPNRSRMSFKAVRDLCITHQVLLFTCHPHLIKQVEEFVPEAKILSLA